MKDSLLVRRYAKALLDYSIENKMEDKAFDDLKIIFDVLKENKNLRNILAEPFISIEKKISIIEKLFKNHVSERTITFISLIIKKKRSNILQDLYGEYKDLYFKYKNIAAVTVTSATQLDKETLSRIRKIINGLIDSKITIENVIDKSIIGGFIINYSDYQYDASIKSMMGRMQKIFEENIYVRKY